MEDIVELTPEALGRLGDGVAVPSYDREALARSIVHIGVGGFHRAHLAGYIDELARGGNRDWGIVGAGVLPGDAAMAEALRAQDGLYTLVERGGERPTVRVIGSIVDYLHAYPDPEPLIAAIASPDTRIVSLTVTEGGYPVDDATGAFAATSVNAAPGSAFAAIVAGLRRRRDEGVGSVTVLSCDNVVGNGEVARTAALGLAGTLDPELAAWIGDHVAFPNSMVDRITPATTDDDRTWLAEHAGIEDRWPVMTEPFRQWVIEDRFVAGRPPVEALGVIVTDDVEPYELVKLRLLNAGHSCLAYLARLADLRAVHEVMAQPSFEHYLVAFLEREAGPVVPPAPGIDLGDYTSSLVSRFANPAIGDQVDRLCLDGSAKFPKFLLPTVRAQLHAGGPVELSALALAGWCQYLIGRSDSGALIEPASDPQLGEAREHALASQDDPAAFLRFRAVFGDDLPRDDRFVAAFTGALRSVRDLGVRRTLDLWAKDAPVSP